MDKPTPAAPVVLQLTKNYQVHCQEHFRCQNLKGRCNRCVRITKIKMHFLLLNSSKAQKWQLKFHHQQKGANFAPMHLPMNQNESSTPKKVFEPGLSTLLFVHLPRRAGSSLEDKPWTNLHLLHLWCSNSPRMISYIVRNILDVKTWKAGATGASE